MIKLTHDLHYIEHQSLALDASILAKTLLVVIRREGR
jgi:lipopolysaccharide/colanic/teichoic acid biosynthesis glycosyltransferase